MSSSSIIERGQFSEEVLAELNKEPDSRDVKSRDVYFGRKKETAYYLDGNAVIQELNRIFRPDGWSFEIDEAYDYDVQDRTDNQGQVFKQRMFYARGKLHIYQDGKHVVTREGAGTNTAESDVPGTMEKAAKGAVTNALKKAALTIGPIFGLNLNSNGRTGAGGQRSQPRQASQTGRNRQPSGSQQRQERQRPTQTTNGTGNPGEVPFDPNPTREPARSAAAQNGSTNGASRPEKLEHVGDLMTWASSTFGLRGEQVVNIARQCGIPELAEIGAVSEIQPFHNDERLLSAITANSK